jgi:hypothetical protein
VDEAEDVVVKKGNRLFSADCCHVRGRRQFLIDFQTHHGLVIKSVMSIAYRPAPSVFGNARWRLVSTLEHCQAASTLSCAKAQRSGIMTERSRPPCMLRPNSYNPYNSHAPLNSSRETCSSRMQQLMTTELSAGRKKEK